jgi:hypothetical protein
MLTGPLHTSTSEATFIYINESGVPLDIRQNGTTDNTTYTFDEDISQLTSTETPTSFNAPAQASGQATTNASSTVTDGGLCRQ